MTHLIYNQMKHNEQKIVSKEPLKFSFFRISAFLVLNENLIFFLVFH